jgi:NADP-dependent aldehyde dehydrogenase
MTSQATVTTDAEVDALIGLAREAEPVLAASDPVRRARLLEGLADALDAARDDLVPLAGAETGLSRDRLVGEVARTSGQLRLFARVVLEGSIFEAVLDDADDSVAPPRPDVRRMLRPLGPVVVFAASNFPFAFSVAGGDTASALAAGCPVIVKAHPGHPELSEATGRLVVAALAEAGAPDGLFSVILGNDAGVAALRAPQLKAASFTGSIAGGRALFDIAAARPEPIPFYGELGSVNPVFVTRAAATARADQIVDGFLASFTMGAGQFCTKPGVLLVPEDSTLVSALAARELPAGVPLLNERIQDGYVHVLGELADHPAVTVLAAGGELDADPPAPTILQSSVTDLLADQEGLFRECFGPTVLVVSYTDEDQLLDVARAIDGQLTATIAGEPDDEVVPELVRLLAGKAGRLLWNQWPTGVSVSYAQQHGGPYPATTSPTTTSVGTAAISRFLRPVAYQGFPSSLLPEVLQDEGPVGVPRRIDGVFKD